jgi:hypothetical protein
MTPESIRPGIPSVNESIAAIERLQLLEPLHDAALKEIERLHAADSLRMKEYNILVAENRKLSAENVRLQSQLALLRERNADLEMDRAVNPAPATQ